MGIFGITEFYDTVIPKKSKINFVCNEHLTEHGWKKYSTFHTVQRKISRFSQQTAENSTTIHLSTTANRRMDEPPPMDQPARSTIRPIMEEQGPPICQQSCSDRCGWLWSDDGTFWRLFSDGLALLALRRHIMFPLWLFVNIDIRSHCCVKVPTRMCPRSVWWLELLFVRVSSRGCFLWWLEAHHCHFGFRASGEAKNTDVNL